MSLRDLESLALRKHKTAFDEPAIVSSSITWPPPPPPPLFSATVGADAESGAMRDVPMREKVRRSRLSIEGIQDTKSTQQQRNKPRTVQQRGASELSNEREMREIQSERAFHQTQPDASDTSCDTCAWEGGRRRRRYITAVSWWLRGACDG